MLRKRILLPVIAIVAILGIYALTLPLIPVSRINFRGPMPPFIPASAQEITDGDLMDIQLSLVDVNFDSQGYKLNATSADISLVGEGLPDGRIRLNISLDLKDLELETVDTKAKIGSGVLEGTIVVSEDNRIVAELEAKTSAIDILRTLIGL